MADCPSASGLMPFSYAELFCRLLGQRDTSYLPNAAYIEFANVASPGDTVEQPCPTSSEALDYYEDLALTPNRDFLRMQLPTANLSLETDRADQGAAYNVMTYNFLTSGSAGVHGMPFSDAANSLVYGYAIVAAPVWSDRTKDLLFARVYYPEASQVPKAAGRQIAIQHLHRWPPMN